MKTFALTKPYPVSLSTDADTIKFANRDDLFVKKLNRKSWDRFAVNFRDVIHEQTHCFNAARNKPNDLECLAVFKGDKPIGGALVKIFKVPGLSTRVAIIRWGPMWRSKTSQNPVQDLKSVYRTITHWLSHEENCFVLVIPKADPDYSTKETKVLVELGFQPSFQPESPERYFVNVDQSCDKVKTSFNQKWRYNLRKSEKSNLKMEILDPSEGLPQFMGLYQSMVERKNFLETSPIETLKSLIESDTPSLRPKIVIASKEGVPVAGAVIDCSGDRAIYLYGATNQEALRLHAGYAIHWAIIQYLVQLKNIRWYDLGGGTGKHCHLHQFKRGMVGKSGAIASIPCYYGYGASLVQNLAGKSLLNLELAKSRIQKTIHEKKTALLGS